MDKNRISVLDVNESAIYEAYRLKIDTRNEAVGGEPVYASRAVYGTEAAAMAVLQL